MSLLFFLFFLILVHLSPLLVSFYFFPQDWIKKQTFVYESFNLSLMIFNRIKKPLWEKRDVLSHWKRRLCEEVV